MSRSVSPSRYPRASSIGSASRPATTSRSRKDCPTPAADHQSIPQHKAPAGVSTALGYDLVGNRITVYDDLNPVTRSYLSNKDNEYTKVSVGLNPTDDYIYDARGNLSRDDGFDGDGDDVFEYSYDIENRLTKVKYDDGTSGLDVVAEYRYDSQGRRIEFIDSVREMTTRYYYDGSNVIIETDESDATQRSYVNGSQYIDERVLMRDHTETIGPGEDEYQDHYYLLAELYSVAGLAACNGLLEETYTYDTYGHVTLREWPRYDVNFNGVTDALDRGKVLVYETSGEPMPSCDVNVDGTVNALDRGAVKTVEEGPDHETVLINYSSVDNPYFFTGRTTDTLHADDLLVENDANFHRIQDNRNRMYDPKHGRWLQRDQAGYRDGMNLHEYARSSPTSRVDPKGLTSYSDIAGRRLEYTCNCGWVDYNHTGDRKIRSIWDQIKAGKGLQSRHSRRYKQGFKVRASMTQYWHGIEGGVYEAYFVKNKLGDGMNKRVALGIWKELAVAFEAYQDNWANNLKNNPSSFSEEDLPSDLLAFYLTVVFDQKGEEARKKKIREHCVSLGRTDQERIARSQCVWKETGGIVQYKNPWLGSHWKPNWHHDDSQTAKCRCCNEPKKWPREFDTILPARKGFFQNWDDWTFGPEGVFSSPQKSQYDEPAPYIAFGGGTPPY